MFDGNQMKTKSPSSGNGILGRDIKEVIEGSFLCIVGTYLWIFGMLSTGQFIAELGASDPLPGTILVQAVLTFFQVYTGRYISGVAKLPKKFQDIAIFTFGVILVSLDVFFNLGGIYPWLSLADSTTAYQAIPFITGNIPDWLASVFAGAAGLVVAVLPELVFIKVFKKGN